MLALAIHSSRYRYRGRLLRRGESQNDTLAKDFSNHRRLIGISPRYCERKHAVCLLCPASVPSGMSGRRLRPHEVVEVRQIESRIVSIVVTKSGRMITSLPSLTLAIWLVMAFSLILLSLVLTWQRYNTRYPGFSILIYFTTLTCLGMLAIGWLASRRTYFWFYYGSLIVWDALTAGVAWEVYRKVFGPAIALPTSTPRRIAVRLLIVLGAWAALSVLLRATASGPFTRLAVTGEQMLYGALAATFCVLVVYAHRMRITWRPRVAVIVRGLAVILVVNLATAIVRGHSSGSLARAAGDVGQFACLLSYFYWVWCFLEKEQPVPTSVPPELVSALARELETVRSTGEVSTQV